LSEDAIGKRAGLAEGTVFAVLAAVSFSHFLNDMIQSLLPAIYPLLKRSFALSFAQVGLITLTFQLTASILQPVVGFFTDRRPKPWSLVFGMGSTFCGILLLSTASHYLMLLLAAALIGTGSSVFHPESSRVARLASGGRHGLAQSVFQVGGNLGQSIGPLLAAFVVVPHGQRSIALFSLAALLAMAVLWNVGRWYRAQMQAPRPRAPARHAETLARLSRRQVALSIAILLTLIFSKYFYMASLTSYFTFYLIARFQLSVQAAQVHLFVFLGAVALGALAGGPLGDHFGRKYVIWFSILGVLPFTLMMPYANLFWTGVLTVAIGLILTSAFAAILVYGTELLPGRIGTVAGLFFGFAFGIGGLGAALLGLLADQIGISAVYRICAFLPAIGLLAAFLPDLEGARRRQAA
jgi:FSR family fosmidomycin resistance protein-like MFS transporter